MKTAIDLMELISSIYLKNFEALGDIEMDGELINSANNRPINTTDWEADKSGVVCLLLIRLKYTLRTGKCETGNMKITATVKWKQLWKLKEKIILF